MMSEVLDQEVLLGLQFLIVIQIYFFYSVLFTPTAEAILFTKYFIYLFSYIETQQ